MPLPTSRTLLCSGLAVALTAAIFPASALAVGGTTTSTISTPPPPATGTGASTAPVRRSPANGASGSTQIPPGTSGTVVTPGSAGLGTMVIDPTQPAAAETGASAGAPSSPMPPATNATPAATGASAGTPSSPLPPAPAGTVPSTGASVGNPSTPLPPVTPNMNPGNATVAPKTGPNAVTQPDSTAPKPAGATTSGSSVPSSTPRPVTPPSTAPASPAAPTPARPAAMNIDVNGANTLALPTTPPTATDVATEAPVVPALTDSAPTMDEDIYQEKFLAINSRLQDFKGMRKKVTGLGASPIALHYFMGKDGIQKIEEIRDEPAAMTRNDYYFADGALIVVTNQVQTHGRLGDAAAGEAERNILFFNPSGGLARWIGPYQSDVPVDTAVARERARLVLGSVDMYRRVANMESDEIAWDGRASAAPMALATAPLIETERRVASIKPARRLQPAPDVIEPAPDATPSADTETTNVSVTTTTTTRGRGTADGTLTPDQAAFVSPASVVDTRRLRPDRIPDTAQAGPATLSDFRFENGRNVIELYPGQPANASARLKLDAGVAQNYQILIGLEGIGAQVSLSNRTDDTNPVTTPAEFRLTAPLRPGVYPVMIRTLRGADASTAMSVGWNPALPSAPNHIIGSIFVAGPSPDAALAGANRNLIPATPVTAKPAGYVLTPVPDAVGKSVTNGPITLNNFHFANGTNRTVALPGEAIPVEVDLVHDAEGPNGARPTQVLVGMQNVGPQVAIYNGTTSMEGRTSFRLLAPQRAGTYAVQFSTAHDANTQVAMDNGWTKPANVTTTVGFVTISPGPGTDGRISGDTSSIPATPQVIDVNTRPLAPELPLVAGPATISPSR